MSRFVLDNTVTMAWCFSEEATEFTQTLLLRLSNLTDSLADLPIEVENPSRTQVFVSVRMLARQYQLTGYDAAYLELAIRHRLPVASLDRALSKAALASGLDTFQA